MKKTKIIVPALGLLLLSTAASVTGTVAWFSANATVTVTGMTVRTKVSSNLMIAETNHVESPAEPDSQYLSDLTQSLSAYLEPASTVDGLAYYYTAASNVNAQGDSKENVFTLYNENTAINSEWTDAKASITSAKKGTNYDAGFNTNYSNTIVADSTNVYFGYVDYVFYLKGTNAEASAKELRMTKCNLLYNSGVVTEKAWRVAVFAQDATKNTNVDTALAAGNRKTILSMASAVNFTDGKAVSGPAALDTVTYNTAAVIKSVDSKATFYSKITVRLWLEGEDRTCNNDTFALLDATYSLDLEFKLDESKAAVTSIGSVAA